MVIDTLKWSGDGVDLIDQTLLPSQYKVLHVTDEKTMWEAIKMLRVRGAPAIGIAAAYGLYLGVRNSRAADAATLIGEIEQVAQYLASARPTAVNLFWALERQKQVARNNSQRTPDEIKTALLDEAHAMHREDLEASRAMGEFGASLFPQGGSFLTHCNAGGLATGGLGTALAPIFLLAERGKKVKVFAGETRPLLQGARLTTWELMKAGIDVTLICDSMAATVLSKKWVDAVIVGTDRVAANGDVANKIGTLGVALLAKHYAVPFYVAAPLSSIDMNLESGAEIPIEERNSEEVSKPLGVTFAPEGVKVFNPAFDVTPHELITAIITEKGIVRPPFVENLPLIFARKGNQHENP